MAAASTSLLTSTVVPPTVEAPTVMPIIELSPEVAEAAP